MLDNMVLSSAVMDVDFGIKGYSKLDFFGSDVYLTSSHICLLIVAVIVLVFAIAANITIRRADPGKAPGGFLNVIEFIVSAVDNMVEGGMGIAHAASYTNYIGTLFIVLVLCNLSGLLGLRPATADYGSTFALAMITFFMIHYAGFKYQKVSHVTNLFKPLILSPINIIGEIATPISMSLRLFGNIL